MVNPTLTRAKEQIFNPTMNAKKLFQVIYKEKNQPETSGDEVPKIQVSDLISKMAFYYEKIRNMVDYKEEHLLRKNAIERILKRQIVIEGVMSIKAVNPEDVARHLLTELIRALYLPNNKIPETKVGEIGRVIEKYIKFRRYSLSQISRNNIKERSDLTNWVIALAASDIEERLGRSQTDAFIVDYMYNILTKSIVLPDDSIYSKDKNIQIYTGIHSCFLKFDRDMLGFILLKYFNGNWQKATDEEVQEIAQNIVPLRKAIDDQIDHPLSGQLNRLISRYTVFFTILKDVIDEDPVKVYDNIKKDPKAFPRQIKQACSKRYAEAKKKLWRAATRSILYIFITKSIFVVLLEVPAIKFFGEELNMVTLGINIAFPAFLLFLVVLFTKLPSDANTSKIVDGIEEVVFIEKERKEPFKLRKPVKRGKGLNIVFGFLYMITFFLSFGAVVWVLQKINFNWLSIIIFLFFLTFVSFFGIRIRRSAKDLVIIPPKENIISFVTDFFYVPIVTVGKWLSERFSRINVFVFILDFIIEAPFKIFVEVAEEWTKYVKERKEDIR